MAAVLETLGEALRLLLYAGALVATIGALAHLLTWLLTRRGSLGWVWSYWYLVGAVLLLAGVTAMTYGWLVLGVKTAMGSALVAFGVLLASAGLWMLVPI